MEVKSMPLYGPYLMANSLRGPLFDDVLLKVYIIFIIRRYKNIWKFRISGPACKAQENPLQDNQAMKFQHRTR